MKGVILCGGLGTRLRPATLIYNKHLALVYDKPMVLFPLETLKQMGIRDVMLVSGGGHVGLFEEFLGDGSEYGLNLTYKVQKDAGGIAQALGLAEGFVQENEPFAVILGDNMFEFPVKPPKGCGIVLKEVPDPQRFGVYFGGEIIEKPKVPPSYNAVVGLYFYTPQIFPYLKTLRPSARGEIEITDINNWCLKNMTTDLITYKGFWSDMGTPDSLLAAANFVKANKEMIADGVA